MLKNKVNPLTAIKDLRRAKYIVTVVARYGFGDIADRLHLPFEPVVRQLVGVEGERSSAQRLRMMLEELGPTFIKLGQFFSMRPDILPPEIIVELQKLQDEVPPVEFSRIRGAVERSLGGPIEETFSVFEAEPLASASIAQVHRARVRGTERAVVCKVRRPGIAETVHSDFNLVAFFARQAHERIRELGHLNLPRVVEEARRAVEQELDFENERENMEFYRRLAGDALEIVIPSVEAELSSRTLLVMEEVAALKASQLEGEAVRKQATDNLVRAFFQQLFHFGFFHADPHASNVFFTPDGRVVFLDWGLVGRLSWKMRFKLSEFLEALVWGDPGWVVDCSLELSGEMEVEDREGLEKEILELLDRFRGQVLKKVNLGRLSIRIFEILGRYRIRVNPYYLVMGRALMNLEGVVRELDPEFDLLSRTRRYLVQVNRERLRPQRLLAVLRRNFYQTATLLEGLPTRLNNIIGKLEQGRLTLVYQHTGLEKVIQTLKVITDRLVIGMILAALIIGSSLIIFTGVKPLLFGYPVLGLLGYLVSALLGLWIIYISIRDRKK